MRALSVCLLLLCPVLSPAKEAQDYAKISCRFLCLETATPPPPLLHITAKGNEISCTIPTNGLSPASDCYATENAIRFVSATDRKPAATATIPPNMKAAILVFIVAEKAPDALPWRVFVLEDSAKNFPDGGAFVTNFHTNDIRCDIGGTKVTLHPEEFHGFARPEPRDAFNMAPVVFEFLQDDTWRIASESMLRFLPGMRYLIFAYLDPATVRPRITTFQDFRAVAKPPPPK